MGATPKTLRFEPDPLVTLVAERTLEGGGIVTEVYRTWDATQVTQCHRCPPEHCTLIHGKRHLAACFVAVHGRVSDSAAPTLGLPPD